MRTIFLRASCPASSHENEIASCLKETRELQNKILALKVPEELQTYLQAAGEGMNLAADTLQTVAIITGEVVS